MKWLMARVLVLANLFQGQWACVADYGKHSLSRRTRLRSSERLGAPLHCTSTTAGGGGGSSIVKVPGDVPPTRVYFFGPLV